MYLALLWRLLSQIIDEVFIFEVLHSVCSAYFTWSIVRELGDLIKPIADWGYGGQSVIINHRLTKRCIPILGFYLFLNYIQPELGLKILILHVSILVQVVFFHSQGPIMVLLAHIRRRVHAIVILIYHYTIESLSKVEATYAAHITLQISILVDIHASSGYDARWLHIHRTACLLTRATNSSPMIHIGTADTTHSAHFVHSVLSLFVAYLLLL